ncbi:MAG: WYL domain-containing transcriptional regulator [Pseudomonadota bacterium]
MRGDQLARQWRILRHIESSRQGLTVAELAELEDVGLRTAYRDLEALQEAGFPLFCERGDKANRWAFVDAYKFQVPQPFTLTELISLHVYGDLIKAFQGTAFYDSLESLFKKVRSTLPMKTLAYLERIQTAFAVGIKPYKKYGQFREIINQVNQAVVEGRRLEIAYHSLHADKEKLRRLDPYRIWFFEGSIYLIGYCHLRKEVRMFVLDRIKMLRLTDEQFKIPKDFNFDEFVGRCFKVMQGDTREVIVHILPEWARWAEEKTWHESQQSRRLEDGGLELTFRVSGLGEIKMWALSLGRQAVVIEPPELRRMVEEELLEAAKQYQPQEASAPRGMLRG